MLACGIPTIFSAELKKMASTEGSGHTPTTAMRSISAGTVTSLSR